MESAEEQAKIVAEALSTPAGWKEFLDRLVAEQLEVNTEAAALVELFSQHVVFVEYPVRQQSNKLQTLWPCLSFSGYPEAMILATRYPDVFGHKGFECMVAISYMTEAIVTPPKMNHLKHHKGRLCRLLGREDGLFFWDEEKGYKSNAFDCHLMVKACIQQTKQGEPIHGNNSAHDYFNFDLEGDRKIYANLKLAFDELHDIWMGVPTVNRWKFASQKPKGKPQKYRNVIKIKLDDELKQAGMVDFRGLFIEPNEPWASVWNKLQYGGWHRRFNTKTKAFIYVKPGGKLASGVMGKDLFSLNDMIARLKHRHPDWNVHMPPGYGKTTKPKSTVSRLEEGRLYLPCPHCPQVRALPVDRDEYYRDSSLVFQRADSMGRRAVDLNYYEVMDPEAIAGSLPKGFGNESALKFLRSHIKNEHEDGDLPKLYCPIREVRVKAAKKAAKKAKENVSEINWTRSASL